MHILVGGTHAFTLPDRVLIDLRPDFMKKDAIFLSRVKSNAPCAVPHMLTKSFSVNSEKIINETYKNK